MVELGYALSSEEHGPRELVRYAERAEDAGFAFASLSDHYHPWISRQGNSPFAWTVLGAIAEATEDLAVGTGVTCPLVRMHPAVVAQAAATTAAATGGRFFLGVGTGENLNEHVVGERWPPHPVRLDMLAEAVEIVRGLWTGEEYSHHGEHFTVENARLFTVPDEPPPLYVAASGTSTATAAGRIGDGLISTAPDERVVEAFAETAGADAPVIGQLTVCWADDEAAAVETAHEWWPNVALPGQLGQDLPTPVHFEQAVELVDPGDVAEVVVCGSDVDEHVEAIGEFEQAGFDRVYIHQVGPDQEAFFEGYERDVLPRVG